MCSISILTLGAAQVLRQLLVGCSYIHQQGVIHRDLKPVRLCTCP